MELPATTRVAEKLLDRGVFRCVEVAVVAPGADLGGLHLARDPTLCRLPLWTCASKSMLAVCVALLVGRGRLAFTDRVADHLPELDTQVWRDVSLADLLSHSVALRDDLGAWSIFRDDDEVLAMLSAAAPAVPAGSGTYLRWTNPFLVGQVIARATGDDCATVLDKELVGPLDLNGTRLPYPMSRMAELHGFARSAGLAFEAVREGRFWPGMSTSGPMRDLARVLAALLPDADALDLSPSVVARVTSVRTAGGTAGNPLDWGLGVVVDRRLAGPRAAANTFGHFGHDGSVVGFADPVRRVAVALALSGGNGTGLAVALRRSAVIDAVLADLRAHGAS